MVTSIIEKQAASSTTAFMPLIAQDPRRIRYELIIANTDVAAQLAFVGSPPSVDAGNNQIYSLTPGQTIIVTRDFFTDLDAVTIGLLFMVTSLNVAITTRETFLTPSAIDEIPDV
jgi:hypothetical protein